VATGALYEEYPEDLSHKNWEHLLRLKKLEDFQPSDWEDLRLRKWDVTHLVGRVIFPVSIPLTLVTTRTVMAEDLKRVADVPWKTYRDSPNSGLLRPYLLRPNQPIRPHWGGGYYKNPLTIGPWTKI